MIFPLVRIQCTYGEAIVEENVEKLQKITQKGGKEYETYY